MVLVRVFVSALLSSSTWDSTIAVCSTGLLVVQVCCCVSPSHLTLCIQATAANYLKRYYLTTSVMDYHPRDIQ